MTYKDGDTSQLSCTFDWTGETGTDADYIVSDIAGFKYARTYQSDCFDNTVVVTGITASVS
jgi:hypothetical protein